MIQSTVHGRCVAKAVTQSPDAVLPLIFLALAFGIIAGAGMARVVFPAVMQVVVPAIVGIVTSA